LGVPFAHEKKVGPATVLIFLGLEIDTIEIVIRNPLHKSVELIKALETMLGKKVTLKELESLVGVLSFFCRGVRSGRAFLRFYDVMSEVNQAHNFIRISND